MLLAVLVDVRVSLAEPVGVRVSVPDGLVDGWLEGDAPVDRDAVGVAVVLGDCDADGLPVPLLVDDDDAVSDSLPVLDAVYVAVALAVDGPVSEGLGRTVRDGEMLGRMLLLMLMVDVALTLAVCEALDVALDDCVAVPDGV